MTSLRCAAILGFFGVGLGAFGAHGLKDRIAADLLAVYQTGVLYHLIHALALLGVAILEKVDGPRNIAKWSFLVGTLLFSGSLYVLAITGIPKFGMITPLGGLGFLLGWLSLVFPSKSGSRT